MIIHFSPDAAEGIVSAPKENSRQIKPDVKDKPVPADVAAKTFSLENIQDGVLQLPTLDPNEGGPPPKEEKKIEEQKFEEKVEEKVEEVKEGEVKEEEKKEEGVERFLKPPKGSQAEKDAETKKGKQHDLSGFDAKEQDILKKMAKEHIPAVMELMKAAKESAKNKENQFFLHPEGYLLHPGFKAEVAIIDRAEKESRIWAKQLKEVKEGIAIKPLVSWDASGNPVYADKEIPASDQIEEEVRNAMNQCMAVASEKRNAVNNFVKNFPQLAQRDLAGIDAERAKRFVWVADPKLMDHTITMEDGVDRSIKQIRNDVINLFPGYMRSTKPAEVCGDLMVALVLAKQELNEYKKNGKITAVKKEEETRVEPVGGDKKPKKTGGQAVNGVRTFSTEGAGIEI